MATQAVAAGLVLLALAAMPAPLLPPHRLAEAVQAMLGVNWKSAYLLAALGLHVLFYGSLGVLATLALNRRYSLRGQILQATVVPCVVVGLAVLVRSIKLGHLPVLANAVVPVIACLAGVGLGFALRYAGRKTSLPSRQSLQARRCMHGSPRLRPSSLKPRKSICGVSPRPGPLFRPAKRASAR